MVSFSRRMWFGSVALSVLLLSSLPGVLIPVKAAEQATVLEFTLQTKSSGFSAQTVRNKLIASATVPIKQDTPTQVVVLASEAQKPAAEVKVVNKPVTPSSQSPKKPVQVASVSATSQVSRGGTSDASVIVKNVQSLLGVPYVFGGTSTKGFDCSGFVQYVYKGSGKSLPRDSYSQYRVGTAVTKDQLQPGDLVFFTTYSKGASHVGIYIGGGRFIHAGDSGVQTTSLSNSYYSARYLGARRI